MEAFIDQFFYLAGVFSWDDKVVFHFNFQGRNKSRKS